MYSFNIIDTTYFDGSLDEATINKKTSYFEENPNLLKIDTVANFYNVTIEFDKIPFKCSYLLNSKPDLKFLLYKSGDTYYRINGFSVSDICYLNHSDFFALRYLEDNNLNIRRIKKYLKKLDYSSLSSELTISVLQVYKNSLDKSLNDNPIISPIKLFFCESTD